MALVLFPHGLDSLIEKQVEFPAFHDEGARIGSYRISTSHRICAEPAVLRQEAFRILAKLVAVVRIRKIPVDPSILYGEFPLTLFSPLLEVRENIVALHGHSLAVLAESVYLRTLVSPPRVPIRFNRRFLNQVDWVAGRIQIEDCRADSARGRTGSF